MSEDAGLSRRGFLRTAGATGAVAAGATGSAAAQEGNGTSTESGSSGGGGGGGGSSEPDFGSWLQGIDGGYEDLRGNSEVTVQVGAQGNGGAFAFSPAGVWVDSGTTVKWEWTGEGGGHNVVADSGPAELGSETYSESGVHFEHTFEESGITNYYCDPHLSLGMKGAVAVGEDIPTVSTGGGGGGGAPSVPDSAKALGVATSVAMVATLGLAYAFLKYGGEPPREGEQA